MSDTETPNQPASSSQSHPGISKNVRMIAAAAVVLVLIVIFLALGSSESPAPKPIAEPVAEKPVAEPIIEEPEPVEQPDVEIPEPIEMPEPEPEPEPEPLDISDAAIKTAVMALSEMPEIGQIIVNDDLLRRFVVFTNNLAEQELAENHQFLAVPNATFRVYRQADKEWIDSASFKRYTVYAEALDSMSTDTLIELYQTYKPAITEAYLEIGDPDDDFNDRLLDAIDHLLDTPEIPLPVEVYSDSVMYKFRNERIENLSNPQKQLLRTGPENMRQIKAKLREIQTAVQELNR